MQQREQIPHVKTITLINPAWFFSHPRERILSQNLGLGYLAAVLERHGHTVRIIDALAQGIDCVVPVADGASHYYRVGLPDEQIVRQIPPDVDLIGITAPFTNHAPIVKQLAAAIKRVFPKKTVVLGGVYPSLTPQDAICEDIDYYVVGEGESALPRLVAGIDPGAIAGVMSRDGRSPAGIRTDPVQELDTLPFPARNLLPMEQYMRFLSPRRRRLRTASVITSRGCPFDCTFCSIHGVTGRQWRKRSAENVLQEIQLLIDRYGIEHIEFEDDNLTLDTGRFRKLLDGLIALNTSGRGLSWSTPNGVKVDTLDDQLVILMHRAGCLSISFPIESGDPELLRRMNKQVDLPKAAAMAEKSVRLGIETTAFFILGYPGETEQSFQRTLAYAKRLKRLGVYPIYATVARAYPGTKLYADCLEQGYLADGTSGHRLFLGNTIAGENAIVTPDFSAADIRCRMRRFERATTPWYLRWYHRHYDGIKRIVPDRAIQLLKRIVHRVR